MFAVFCFFFNLPSWANQTAENLCANFMSEMTVRTDGEKFVAQGPRLHCVDLFRGKKHKGIFLCKIFEQEQLTKAAIVVVIISVCEH